MNQKAILPKCQTEIVHLIAAYCDKSPGTAKVNIICNTNSLVIQSMMTIMPTEEKNQIALTIVCRRKFDKTKHVINGTNAIT
jgi:hypothetical protein